MGEKLFVSGFVGINNAGIVQDGELLLKWNGNSFEERMDEAYKTFALNYPKFHKMDNLSKLGFLTAECLLKNQELDKKFNADKIAIVLSNKSSSLDTDLKYQKMLEKGIASPAVFVYTLPNILIGEICIRYKFKGESIFLISDTFNAKQQIDYVRMLFNNGIADACIAGWVELLNGVYESFIYLVTKEDSKSKEEFTEERILKMYNQI